MSLCLDWINNRLFHLKTFKPWESSTGWFSTELLITLTCKTSCFLNNVQLVVPLHQNQNLDKHRQKNRNLTRVKRLNFQDMSWCLNLFFGVITILWFLDQEKVLPQGGILWGVSKAPPTDQLLQLPPKEVRNMQAWRNGPMREPMLLSWNRRIHLAPPHSGRC